MRFIKRRLLKFSIIVFGIFLIFLLTFKFLEFTLIGKTFIEKADAIVALGGGISKENLPTTSTYERVMCAYRVYCKGYAPVVVLCGGYAKSFYVRPECDAMEEIIKKKKLALNYVKEQNSVNTYTAAVFLRRNFNFRKVILITSPPHNLRALLTFKKQGFVAFNFVNKKSVYFKCNFLVRFKYLLYELFALFYYYVKGYV